MEEQLDKKDLAIVEDHVTESIVSDVSMRRASGEREVNTESVNIVETVGGSSTRRFINQHITEHLLEGMRLVALQKPENPLRFLGEYLISQAELKSGNR